jgi:alanyl-tRNA synthetase
MAERLYYTDAYLTRFDARVTRRSTHQGQPAVMLDRTAFYPASGGQPSDRGRIDAVAVIDVIDLDDGDILHLLERPVQADVVSCDIDWVRRRDHMQQHTGQHLLSAALERVHRIRTDSFHLGAESSTIDVSASVTLDRLASVEEEANRVIWENRPVHVRFADEAEAAALPLRKPPARGGTLRVIEIESFDVSACGGTHVARTGELGLLAVTSTERYKGGTRLEFVCGGRALVRFQALRLALGSAARLLSSSGPEVPSAIERLQSEGRQQKHAARQWQERAIDAEAERLLRGAAATDPVIARHLTDWDPPALKALAAAIGSRSQARAVLAGAEPGTVVVACGRESAVDASAVVRHLTARFGGRGGGRPELAQAGGLAASPEEILEAARELM